MDTKEHVVVHPLGLEFVVRVAAHNLSAHFPRAGHGLDHRKLSDQIKMPAWLIILPSEDVRE